MATVPFLLSTIDIGSTSRAQVTIWSPLTNTNVDGEPFAQSAFYGEKSVQVIGTFGGATLTLWGSNVPLPGAAGGADWFILHKNDETGLVFTTASGFTILDVPLYIAPVVSGGAGSSLSVYLLCATTTRR